MAAGSCLRCGLSKRRGTPRSTHQQGGKIVEANIIYGAVSANAMLVFRQRRPLGVRKSPESGLEVAAMLHRLALPRLVAGASLATFPGPRAMNRI